MEEGNDLASVRIDGRDVGTLLQVAVDAAEAEVVDIIRATMLATNDMVNLVWDDGSEHGNAAILPGVVSAAANESANVG
jgi:hypothetical protein